MEYEQFFPTETSNNCNCYTQVKIAMVSIGCIALLLDCIYACRTKSKITALKDENNTLRSIIRSSVDDHLRKIIKNGYDVSSE
jgi:hypothetical protein